MSRITREEVRNLGLASLGAMLECYDFVVFVFVAVALGNALFPPESSAWLRLVQVFSIYAVGYFVRPVAGLVIAHFADRVGRAELSWLFLPVGIACGCVIALVPGLIASLFPTAVRQTGYAISYNFGSAIFSGPGPLVLAWSVREFGAMSPLHFFLVACAVALCVAALVGRVPRYLGQSTREANPASAEAVAAPW